MTDEKKGILTPPEPRWVHTLGHHDVGSVFGWLSDDSPTGYWSGIVCEVGPCSVKVDKILPGRIVR